MKICYCYRRKQLGVLEKIEDGYVYNSDIANEQYFRDKMMLVPREYGLWNSVNRKSKTLFPEMMDVVHSCSREDIVRRAQINHEDTPWERLVKLSSLKWLTQGFYVQQLLEDEEVKCN